MFKTIYAIPNFEVYKDNYHKYIIEESQLEQAHKQGLTIAVRLEDEDFGVLDFDAHAGTSGIDLYNQLCSEYPDFFNNTRTEKSGNGGIHVYFKKDGQYNQSGSSQSTV